MGPVSATTPNVCSNGLINPVLDALPDVLLYLDADGVIQVASRRFKEFFGLPPEDLVGKPVNVFAETLARCFTEFMTYHEVIGHPLQDREQEFLRDVEVSSPQHRFLQVASAPVRKDEAFAGRIWLMRDITHEREITELKIQYGGIRSADEIKSKFLTVASHQLRTPMNSMRWNLELLLSGDSGTLPPETLEVMREIYKSVVNSISIVDDMLLAVDIEQRTLRLEKTPVDIGDVVGKVVRDFSRSAALKSISIVLRDPPKAVPPLFLDRDKMETVFARLLDNAIKYSPEHATVEVAIAAGKADVSVSVKDAGVGIPEKERTRVFERFYRSKKSIELHPNASGLGLYIAKFIVDAHDGTIRFVSEEGKGTTFTVTLPRRATA
jgi:two-component system phosphate regulon sensor histidine kinase PhoR